MRSFDLLSPTGFKFLTNVDYGREDSTKEYQQFVEKLQGFGYIIHVADAVDINGVYYSTPLSQCIAVYVKRNDGREIDIGKVWNQLYPDIEHPEGTW